MTQTPDRPGIDQLRNLADRAERGSLTPDEATRLRDGIDQLATRAELAEADRDGWRERAQGYRTRAERAEATLNAIRKLATWIRRNYPGLDHGRRLLDLLDQHGQTPKETT